jgi:uncharacterized protein (TIGR02145 family)
MIVQPYGFISPKVKIAGFGYLYNDYAVRLAGFSSLTDFSIPTTTECSTLNTFLGVDAGGKMKINDLNYWNSPNTGATNASGFTGLGSGIRTAAGSFASFKSSLYMITATVNTSYVLSSSNALFTSSSHASERGTSVRMIYTGGGTPGATVTDYDGNVYDVVQIGTQYWTVQNYKCTKLNDGTPITKITDNTAWANDTLGAYCAYDNNESLV